MFLRVALDTYRAQRRGGKGRSGMTTKEEDVLSNVFVSNTSRGKLNALSEASLPSDDHFDYSTLPH